MRAELTAKDKKREKIKDQQILWFLTARFGLFKKDPRDSSVFVYVINCFH